MKISAIILLLYFSGTLYANAQCPPTTAFDYLDINNVKARINNGGDMWWDLQSSVEYIVPKTGNISATFAGALWIGGIDAQGQLHVAAQAYRQSGNDYFAGPLDETGNVTTQTCSDFDRIWKVNKSTIDSFIAGLFVTPPASIAQWPGRGNPNLPFLPNQRVAPFIDVDGDLLYNSSEGDYPAIPGDQALWFVFNDAGGIHSESGGLPLGVEVQCFAYAVKDSTTCTYSTTFYHYNIINKSINDYDSVFVGFWNDADLGCMYDDYFGSDSLNHLMVVYNMDSIDGPGSICFDNYPDNPPTFAIQILKGPTDKTGAVRYLDHAMVTYKEAGMGYPVDALDFYEYMQSIWRDGTHLTYGGNGYGESISTNFIYPDDPSLEDGWSACAENNGGSDFRLVLSSGPFAIASGEEQTFDFAVLWEKDDVYPCPSFENITALATCNRNYFDSSIVFTSVENQSVPSYPTNVFPNPASLNDELTFTLNNVSLLELYDLAGRKFKEFDVRNQRSLRIKTNFGTGIFFYRLTLKDHAYYSGKFVVE
jgi:hypothetical protein